MHQKHVEKLDIQKFNGTETVTLEDWIAVEAPLEIHLAYADTSGNKISESLTITMRTPGNDAELALGFLLTEGLITRADQVAQTSLSESTLRVEMAAGFRTDTRQLERNFLANSSCGVCGKSSIENIRQPSSFPPLPGKPSGITSECLYALPEVLYRAQNVFHHTGGLHASGLFDTRGKLILIREDVGRHNALDKLLGAALMENKIPLDDHILMLSGRISFELVQKAAMAGIGFIAAVGAPSTLAVSLAREYGITLIGFLRDKKFNIYSESNRLSSPLC
jgi:FdhD protein